MVDTDGYGSECASMQLRSRPPSWGCDGRGIRVTSSINAAMAWSALRPTAACPAWQARPVTRTSIFARPRWPVHSWVSLGSLVTKASGRSAATGSASAPPSISSSHTLATTTTRDDTHGAAATPQIAAAMEAFWSQIPSP